MADLTSGFLKAIEAMGGQESVEHVNSITGLSLESTDIEILDYIMVQLCSCLDTKKMAFKGGYMLNKIITNETPRETIDVDFSIQSRDYYEYVKKVLDTVGRNLVSDGIFESYNVKESATETCTGGLDLNMDSKRNKKKLGVDVGIHDITHGVVPVNVLGVDVKRFSVERMLSDKLSAIYSRKRFRRPKDLYDFYIITNCFDVDMVELNRELGIRGIDWSATPMRQEVLIQYEKAYNTLSIPGVTNDEVKMDSTDFKFSTVINRIEVFHSMLNESKYWRCFSRSFE